MAHPLKAAPAAPRALLLAHNRTIALQVLYSLAEAAEVHVLGTAGTECLRFSRRCRSYRREDPAGWAVAIRQIMDRERIDIVVPADDVASTVLSQLAVAHDIPTFPLSSCDLLRQYSDKWQFHLLCEEHGVPTPVTVSFAGKELIEPSAVERRIGYPLVVKPVDGSNSVGVVVARSRAELRDKVLTNPGYSFGALVVQRFAPGIDIDCSVLAIDGTIIAEAVQTRRGRTVLFQRCPPLSEVCRTLVGRTRFSGVAHFDARYDADTRRVMLIECNPRFWASLEAARWCGLNFAAAGLRPARADQDARLLVEGAYLHPAGMIEALAKLRWRSVGLSRASLGGLVQMLGDPIPFLLTELYAWRRRREESRRMRISPAPGRAGAVLGPSAPATPRPVTIADAAYVSVLNDRNSAHAPSGPAVIAGAGSSRSTQKHAVSDAS